MAENKTRPKTARTTKEYKVRAFGHDLVVPAGSVVSNRTACGPDDNYRFWESFYAKGNSLLIHDLKHYGLNIPAEYCAPSPED